MKEDREEGYKKRSRRRSEVRQRRKIGGEKDRTGRLSEVRQTKERYEEMGRREGQGER